MWCRDQIVQQCGWEFRTTPANALTACLYIVHVMDSAQWAVHCAQCQSGHPVNTLQCRWCTQCTHQCTEQCTVWAVQSAQCQSGHLVNTLQCRWCTQCTHQCTMPRWTWFRSRDSFPTKAGTTIKDFYGEKRQTWGDNKSLDAISISPRDKHFIQKFNLIQHITYNYCQPILIESQCTCSYLETMPEPCSGCILNLIL